MFLLKFLGVFFVTLISYYNFELNFSPFVLMGAAILILVIILNLFNKNAARKVKHQFFIPTTLFLFVVFVFGQIASISAEFPVLYARYAVPILVALAYWFIWQEFNLDFKDLTRALSIIIWIHLFFFYLQFLIFAVFGYFLDFIEPITGETQRNFGGSYTVSFLNQFFRASGLFSEPGTYANVMFPIFLTYRALCERYIKCKSKNASFNSTLNYLVFFSMVLSFSFFGYVFILVYGLVRTFFGGRFVYGLLFFVFFAFILYFIGGEYIVDRIMLGEESGTGFRMEGMLEFVNNLNFVSLFLGWGFLSDTTLRYPHLGFNDIGLMINVILFTGVIGFILFIYMIFGNFNKMNSYEICLVVVLILSKLTITYLIFWIFLGYLSTIRLIRGGAPARVSENW